MPDSGPSSGTGMTLGDIPGGWDSITLVWTGTPTSLQSQVEAARHALRSEDLRQIAVGCWLLFVSVLRGLLHLGSWVLEHPLRTLAAVLLLGVLIGSLTI